MKRPDTPADRIQAAKDQLGAGVPDYAIANALIAIAEQGQPVERVAEAPAPDAVRIATETLLGHVPVNPDPMTWFVCDCTCGSWTGMTSAFESHRATEVIQALQVLP